MIENFADEPRTIRLVDSQTVFHGAIWDVQQDRFSLGDETDESLLTRQYITHTGAVAILAVDDQQRACLVKQYRHPVRANCWETPAGLLDVPGESLLDCARRELAEEAGLEAATWEVLADHHPSGGSSAEGIRVFLATGLAQIAEEDRAQLDGEEAEMQVDWVPVEKIAQAIFAGKIHNSNTIIATLAYLTQCQDPERFVSQPLENGWLGRAGAPDKHA